VRVLFELHDDRVSGSSSISWWKYFLPVASSSLRHSTILVLHRARGIVVVCVVLVARRISATAPGVALPPAIRGGRTLSSIVGTPSGRALLSDYMVVAP
jgi:hypothetical protein